MNDVDVIYRINEVLSTFSLIAAAYGSKSTVCGKEMFTARVVTGGGSAMERGREAMRASEIGNWVYLFLSVEFRSDYEALVDWIACVSDEVAARCSAALPARTAPPSTTALPCLACHTAPRHRMLLLYPATCFAD